MARLNGLHLAGFAAGVLAFSPAAQAQLDPRVAGPLQAMYQQAAIACQQGAPAGCQQMQALQQAAGQLTQAQGACQMGNQQACMVFQNGAQQVVMAWQQMQMGMAGAAPAQGYSPQQQQFDHQQRMMQQQQQFQQHQQMMQQRQQQMDQSHQRFMQQLRQ
ncbi:hypothetical protein [Roseomonas sp. AR75]|uniref:hypothetical protein n=1 Tax=Roseomonas sp. AR75 TaxID=2562311 RepID=UPI0010BFE181|nr:hypothetical protein [Roseomonas sp. AR75]